MSTYIAWDGKEYPLPVPEGWYLGTDDRWWPEGHGPGHAPNLAETSGLPSAAPPGRLPSASPPTGSDRTIYSSPVPGSGSPSPLPPLEDGGGGAKRFVVPALVVLALGGLAVVTFLRVSGDDEPAFVAETAPETTVVGVDAQEAAEVDGETSATVTTAPPGKGAAENPYAIGELITASYTDVESGELRTWNIEVAGPPSDITDAVLDENQFNEPPEGERRYVGLPLRITYVSGPEPASLFELTFKAIAPSGEVLTTFDPSCGVIPDALDSLAEVTAGGVLEGNVCWSALPADAERLTMLIEVFLEDTQIYVDLAE